MSSNRENLYIVVDRHVVDRKTKKAIRKLWENGVDGQRLTKRMRYVVDCLNYAGHCNRTRVKVREITNGNHRFYERHCIFILNHATRRNVEIQMKETGEISIGDNKETMSKIQ